MASSGKARVSKGVVVAFITAISIFLFDNPCVEAQATNETSNTVPVPAGLPVLQLSDAYIGDLCLNDTLCTNAVPNSECVDAGDNSGNSRCRCISNYYAYNTDITQPKNYTRCGKLLTSATNPECKDCENNEGVCVQQDSSTVAAGSNGIFCQCPISRTGASCEIIHVNVSCSMTAMNICYSPHPQVNFTAGWRMYTVSHANIPKCCGTGLTADTPTCSTGNEELSLSLNMTDLSTCGTTYNENSQNRRYMNSIEIRQFDSLGNEMTTSTPVVFNVYCSFTAYADETFNGIGVGEVNGNDRGTQVNANVTFYVTDQFSRMIGPGVTLLVGDLVRFVIGLQQDQNYNNMQVLRCTASSSAVMPDSEAETRALMTNGCPVSGDSTASSWYWTQQQTGSWTWLTSGAVPIFKLSSSDFVYMHCALKLCVQGDTTCQLMTQASCANSGRRKRDVSDASVHGTLLSRAKRATSPSVDIQTGLKVQDNNASPQTQGQNPVAVGSTGFIVLLVILAVIALALIIVAMVFAVRIRRRKSVGNADYQPRPQLFALPRINRTHERF